MFVLFIYSLFFIFQKNLSNAHLLGGIRLYVEVYLIGVLIFLQLSLIALYISSAVAVASRLPNGVPIEASTEKPFGTLFKQVRANQLSVPFL